MNKAKTLKLSILLVLCSIKFINAQFDIDFGIKGGVFVDVKHIFIGHGRRRLGYYGVRSDRVKG